MVGRAADRKTWVYRCAVLHSRRSHLWHTLLPIGAPALTRDPLQLELPAPVPPYTQVIAQSPKGVDQRLAAAEQALRVQFIRIAQLQAQLDLLLGALRRSRDGTPLDDR
jgi:hypothetical protein